MNNWADPFRERLQLLTDLLPIVARETRFALKGGTAINLFEHDLPRLSVDVDLTWLPVGDFAEDRRAITAAFEALATALRAPPLRLHVAPSAPAGADGVTRLIASRPGARVQIETTPVMRGTVHPVRTMTVQPKVQAEFGFAEMQVLHFADLYAGKLAAALSRQHPRDWFDVGLLLDSGRLDANLWRTFLVYLSASPKPASEILEPGEPRDLATAYRTQFEGMTAQPPSSSMPPLMSPRSWREPAKQRSSSLGKLPVGHSRCALHWLSWPACQHSPSTSGSSPESAGCLPPDRSDNQIFKIAITAMKTAVDMGDSTSSYADFVARRGARKGVTFDLPRA